jgi:dolichyl-phosphate-mannose-protein mannosyltransferase
VETTPEAAEAADPADPAESPGRAARPQGGSRLRRADAALRGSRLGALVARVVRVVGDPGNAIALVFISSLLLRAMWLNVPSKGLIFDEAYYVNAARVILGLEPTNHYADSAPGFDPNTEHPALGKLVLAASMAVLGDNSVAWRLPSVIFGMIALAAVFLIARDTTKSAWLPVAVTALVAFDNLTFVHGRIGTLDMLVLAPMLVGAWLALRRRWILAGIAMGIALLIKITAIYGVGAVILYWLLTDGLEWVRARRRPQIDDVRGPVGFIVITLSIMLGGLTILDATLSQFPSPVDHIARILTYGANLKAPITVGHCPEIDSRPWQWLFNDCQINYYRTDVTVRAGDEVTARYAKIAFIGALNPLLASALPLAGLFAGWYAWRTRNRMALWAIAWGAANYLPFVLLAALTPRIMYIYYALPLVPAAAMAIALLLARAGLPRAVSLAFIAAYLVGFVAFFPFREIP